MTVAGAVFIAVCWCAFGAIAYSFARNTYKWSKNISLIFACGGPLTALGAMFDVHMHTSMMGEYTRDWKNDPDTVVVTWRELDGKPPLTMSNKVFGLARILCSNSAQTIGAFWLYGIAIGDQSVRPDILGAISAVWLVICLAIMLHDVGLQYTRLSHHEIRDRTLMSRDVWSDFLMFEIIIGFFLMIPAWFIQSRREQCD